MKKTTFIYEEVKKKTEIAIIFSDLCIPCFKLLIYFKYYIFIYYFFKILFIIFILYTRGEFKVYDMYEIKYNTLCCYWKIRHTRDYLPITACPRWFVSLRRQWLADDCDF